MQGVEDEKGNQMSEDNVTQKIKGRQGGVKNFFKKGVEGGGGGWLKVREGKMNIVCIFGRVLGEGESFIFL